MGPLAKPASTIAYDFRESFGSFSACSFQKARTSAPYMTLLHPCHIPSSQHSLLTALIHLYCLAPQFAGRRGRPAQFADQGGADQGW